VEGVKPRLARVRTGEAASPPPLPRSGNPQKPQPTLDSRSFSPLQSAPMSPRFLSENSRIQRWRNRLPHWHQIDTIYFVTFRLGDALPAGLVRKWEEERSVWLKHHPEPWSPSVEREYFNRFPRQIERWLDQGSGDCILRESRAAELVGAALLHGNGQRYQLLCCVVMPNHVHAIVAPIAPVRIEEVVQTWKSYTAHALNKLLGRNGQVWQKDYFDRIVRDEEHLSALIGYIRRNSVKAGLSPREYLLWESEECGRG
jgi:putative transposase